ncbi:MAG: right-handed parallel beta-helix repeat-containing protein [Armatimonadetes bacterium]|nr:right-handed parallel beta-helix repeat-containing protein [Armatimonadota bacterium]
MDRRLFRFFFFLGVFMFGGLMMAGKTSAVPKADFYVSTCGSDLWSGTLPAPNAMYTDGPFASIERAQKAARILRKRDPKCSVKIIIRGGTYWLDKPLVFKPEDSNTIYAAYPGEKPVLSGGRQITGWKKAKEKLWKVELAEVKAGRWSFRDLYVNGERRRRPRLPREGFFHIEKPISPEVKDAFIYPEGSIRPWKNLDDVEVIVFNAWDELRLRIASINEQTRTVNFTGSNNWPFGAWGQGSNRFYIENVYEALDEPGEWYLDQKEGILYYYPLPGESMSKVKVIAPILEELVIIDGDVENQKWVNNLVFRGLSFQYTGWHLPAQGHIPIQAEYSVGVVLVANGAQSCEILDCEFTHLGKYAIHFGSGCKNNKVADCHIYDMGAGGIKIGLPTNNLKDSQKTENNVILNNHIHDLGKTYLCAVGIWIGGSGNNRIAYNHIHDLNYSGISVGWTWGYGPSLAVGNVIEHNHIHDLGKGLLSDMGGIYTLGVSPGTVLRNNLIHDVVSYSYGGWGIYFDEGSTGIIAECNIVYDCKSAGFHQHYGRENIVRNNIFAFGKEAQIQRTRAEGHISFIFENNIVYWTEGNLFAGNMKDGSIQFDKNIYWNASGKPVEFPKDWKERGLDVHSIIADPLFMNPEKHDFRLKKESPAFALGFKEIKDAGD